MIEWVSALPWPVLVTAGVVVAGGGLIFVLSLGRISAKSDERIEGMIRQIERERIARARKHRKAVS
jgi:hypothetical protein